jgi:hypothetical protein
VAKRKKPGPVSRGKTATVIARVTPDTRKLLESAARKAGHSLSREIEDRLDASFIRLQKRVEEFGDFTTYTICRLIAVALSDIKNETGHPWHRHPWVYEHARAAIDQLLSYFRPPGDAEFPEDFPVIEGLKEGGCSQAMIERWKRQLEQFPFGLAAAERAVLGMEGSLEESLVAGEPCSEYHKQMLGLAAVLKMRLMAAGNKGKALLDLKELPNFDWS